MKILKSKYDKSLIKDLPKVLFEGSIHVIISEDAAERAVDYLLTQPVLGFDTETRPNFKKGKGMNKVALLQVATEDMCFLFRLNRIGMPACILRLLGDESVIKVGLSWRDDLLQLNRSKRFVPGTFCELQLLVRQFGIEDQGLQKLYANIFGEKVSKSQRLTNWEMDNLSPSQQRYAATDAWACVRIYNELKRLRESGDYCVEHVEEVDENLQDML